MIQEKGSDVQECELSQREIEEAFLWHEVLVQEENEERLIEAEYFERR